MSSFIIFLLVFFALLTFSSIKVVGENQRFATFSLGRFTGIKGPGLLIKPLGPTSHYVRIALRAQGVVQSGEFVLLSGHAVPYTTTATVHPGSVVRVVGFTPSAVQVMPTSDHVVVCEKCGHENHV